MRCYDGLRCFDCAVDVEGADGLGQWNCMLGVRFVVVVVVVAAACGGWD